MGSAHPTRYLIFNYAQLLIERVLLPQLWVGAIVVMDNLPGHHAKLAEELIKSVGASVKFLPPYSPDLSPIELCWSKLKEILRSIGARTTAHLERAISVAIDRITDDNALSWFHHCGLYLEKIR
ncbi:transposase [Chamaesiphon minutus]|uniref:transposase n=1 Tax=Chamaesiphon minutus TaxID=1173032 RepID=UPI0012FBA92A